MSRPPSAHKPPARPKKIPPANTPKAKARTQVSRSTATATKRASNKISPARSGRKTKPCGRHPRLTAQAIPRPALSRWSARLAWWRRVPGFVYFFCGLVLVAVLVPTVNWVYQVVHKPTELFFPVSEDGYKTPSQTWRDYGPLFIAHATPIMTAELLAALAQKEASGNPLARTYWRWSATTNFFEIFRPASSAVGMYQFTDGTFDEARHYCIHDHQVVADGPWHDRQSCWFNSLYARVIPSHAVELASSNLDRRVHGILARSRRTGASLRQQQELAIITHLCGAGAGAAFAARGLQLRPAQRCGDHDARDYVEGVMALAQRFAQLRKE